MNIIYETIASAAIYAVITVAIVEALHKRIAALDGWYVLIVAGVAAIVLTLIFAPAYTMPDLLEAGRIALIAWLLAVGGDAWVAKIALKAKTVTITDFEKKKPDGVQSDICNDKK
jgi:hypothetical protein